MKMKKVYLYVFDTMSDWEIGYLTAELNSGRYFKKEHIPIKLITVGVNENPITTMGGLKVIPEISIKSCHLEKDDMLILPGGETWTTSNHESILEKSVEASDNGNFVAGICGATLGLAKKGLLDTRNHTSNDLEFLKMMIPEYSGESYYKKIGAVNDDKLITASGISPLEFTVEVLKALDVCEEAVLNAWLNLYKTQDSKYFFELMSLTQ